MAVHDDGDIVRGLGYVTLYAAYVEEAVEECVAVLAAVDQAPPNNLNKRPISERIAYIEERLKGFGQLTEEMAQMPDLLIGVRDLLRWRNEIIHGRIYGGLQGAQDELRPSRADRSLRPITSEELYSLANQMMAAVPSLNAASMFQLRRLVARGPL